jgi:hypothetical protein
METPEETEARMLAKSIADHVAVRYRNDGRYATRSLTTPRGLVYVTTPTSCTCPATVELCKHIAAVRAEEAKLTDYWRRVRESRRQSAAAREIMAEVEAEHGSWRMVTGAGRIGKRATFHRPPASAACPTCGAHHADCLCIGIGRAG